MKLMDILPVKKERLSAQDFLKLAQTQPGLIKKSRPVVSPLGRGSGLAFDVHYSRAIYKTLKFDSIAR